MIFFVAKHYLKCHLTRTPDISPDLDSVPLIYWISVIALLQSFMRNMWSNDLAVTIVLLVLCWEGSFMNETLWFHVMQDTCKFPSSAHTSVLSNMTAVLPYI